MCNLMRFFVVFVFLACDFIRRTQSVFALIFASQVFGLHDNVNITSAIKESQSIFDTMLSLQPRSATGVCSGFVPHKLVVCLFECPSCFGFPVMCFPVMLS